ncbi:hypothetical protein GCM10011383_33250 [Hymenobacter cavernae]|uniref:Uncharacterized protein n=1 Tax=Hymenobacter cavernae TaxID=2044852 RepID=A0ABQ1UK96_9BACT|nr:hypothetical protein GCM10011383_33250 [Hymenobacter cavernae]
MFWKDTVVPFSLLSGKSNAATVNALDSVSSSSQEVSKVADIRSKSLISWYMCMEGGIWRNGEYINYSVLT